MKAVIIMTLNILTTEISNGTPYEQNVNNFQHFTFHPLNQPHDHIRSLWSIAHCLRQTCFPVPLFISLYDLRLTSYINFTNDSQFAGKFGSSGTADVPGNGQSELRASAVFFSSSTQIPDFYLK